VSVAGIDLSLTSTGLCVVEDRAVTTHRITSKGSKADSVAARAARLVDLTNAIMRHIPVDVDLIMIEGPSLGQARQAGEFLRAGLWWGLVTPLSFNGNPIAEVPPSVLKKYAVGRGNAAKDDVLASAIRRYPHVDITSNDIADATVLAAMGARHLGEPIESSLPQLNLTAMQSVQWPEAGA
jgi:Holliday junction resolvasome RuvABC endonuclease subunit